VYDRLRGTAGWPVTYNGRGLLNQSFRDHEAGMPEEENRKLYEDAMKVGDQGWGGSGRMTTYAGSGVGLIHTILPAGDIVREVLKDSRDVLVRAVSNL
jgi:nitronate monooxygenase